MAACSPPPEAGGFSFPVPYAGTIQDMQVSADLLVASVSLINLLGIQYDFTVFRAPSVPTDANAHVPSAYVTTPLTTSVRFGFPNSSLGCPSLKKFNPVHLRRHK